MLIIFEKLCLTITHGGITIHKIEKFDFLYFENSSLTASLSVFYI